MNQPSGPRSMFYGLSVEDLAQLCQATSLDDISFRYVQQDGLSFMVASAYTEDTDGTPHQLRLWHGPDPKHKITALPDPADPESVRRYRSGMEAKFSHWLGIDNQTMRYHRFIADPAYFLPDLADEDAAWLKAAAMSLQVIHRTATALINDLVAPAQAAAYADLTDEVATRITDAGNDAETGEQQPRYQEVDEDEEEPDDWEDMLAVFTELCHVPGLAGVTLERSPQLLQAIDISSDVIGSATDELQRIRIFWSRGADGDVTHWIGIGPARIEAHGVVDVSQAAPHLRPDTQEEILRVLDHLHDLAHVAESVAQQRREEIVDDLHEEAHAVDVAAAVRDSDEDILVAMNAIARLHTGRPLGENSAGRP